MASFTAALDNTILAMNDPGEVVGIAISGTYAMTIELQREQGSPGSGSWAYVSPYRYSTANATVAATYTTGSPNERLRLIATAVTSGTGVAVLTDNTDKMLNEIRDTQGNLIFRITQKGVEIGGALRRILSPGAGGGPNYLITASLTLTAEDHAGKTGLFDVAGGATATLPAATGTGNKYRFAVKTTLTSSGIIKVANSTDIIQGVLSLSTDISGTNMLASATADTITMNGTTTGGLKGSVIEIEDVAAGLFVVTGGLVTTGVEADPFSATV